MNGNNDPVNHPAHYHKAGLDFECIDITRNLSFDLGNAIKYLWRWRGKNGVEDLEKALFYLKDLGDKYEPIGGDVKWQLVELSINMIDTHDGAFPVIRFITANNRPDAIVALETLIDTLRRK